MGNHAGRGFTLMEVLVAIALLAAGASASLFLLPQLHQINDKVVRHYERDAWAQTTLSKLDQRALFRGRYLSVSTSFANHNTEQLTVSLKPQSARFAEWTIQQKNHTFSGAFENYGRVRDPDQILVRECRSEPPAMVD